MNWLQQLVLFFTLLAVGVFIGQSAMHFAEGWKELIYAAATFVLGVSLVVLSHRAKR